jgi:hypothetical protein
MRRLLALLWLCAACPGELHDPERFRGDYCISSTERLIRDTCAQAGCHDSVEHKVGLDLSIPDVGPTLVNRPAAGIDEADAKCDGRGLLIHPVEPTQSLMYLKTTPNYPCGDRMPQFRTPLTGEQLDCMLEWIAAQQ